MSERANYERVRGAWVARNPQAKGVIEFYGGALFELRPALFYEEYLQGLFDAGYTIVAVTFPLSFDHTNVAAGLVPERRELFDALQLPPELPRAWVGHSVGCKIISLLQVLTSSSAADNARQPALLLAPDISGTDAAVPWPLSWLLDTLGLGVRPTEAQTQQIIAGRCDVLVAAALISFASDTIAGNAAGTLPKGRSSSVQWFIDTLGARSTGSGLPYFTHEELPGGHLAPLGFRFGWRPWAVATVLGRAMMGRRGRRAAEVATLVQQSVVMLDALGAAGDHP